MQTAERHPFDYNAMNKGDLIPPERVEQVTGLRRDNTRYTIALMQLRNEIERELWDRGRQYMVKTEKGGIRVMDDASASIYNHKGVGSHARRLLRCHFRNTAVDVTRLDANQRKDHERYLERDGKLAQAVASSRPRLQPKPVQRMVPGLPAIEP